MANQENHLKHSQQIKSS